MKKKFTLLILISLAPLLCFAEEVGIFFNFNTPQHEFAAIEIKAALEVRGFTVEFQNLALLTDDYEAKNVIIALASDSNVIAMLKNAGDSVVTDLGQQSYALRNTTNTQNSYWILGGDDVGAMYGGLEVAENITLNGFVAIKDSESSPYLEKRGVKLNIPLDARTPSYADAGSAAQNNIPEMWSWDFWTNHLDNLARYRYNAITLWSLHHFPSLVKVPDYPNVALNDVKRSTIDFKAWFPGYNNSGANMYNSTIANNLETLKVMTIDEKIEFWRDVMEYAKNRGIEFYLITWNVFTSSAQDAGYGITNSQSNATTKDYLRKSVEAAFETYPLLKGIGVTAGENMNEGNKEVWLWDTYGQGLVDAQNNDDSGRNFEFIHRHWWSDMSEIKEQFNFDDNVEFNFSYKYARARLYSRTDPTYINNLLGELPAGSRFWLNLRNDDIYNFRWGDVDYVRDYIYNMPSSDKITGFHMGSDGYVWGREFTSTEPETPRELEIEKHWYNFMLWGRLGYDPGIPDNRFQKLIQIKFPEVHASELTDVWERASKIIPIVNLSHWHDWDFQWSVEYCRDRYNYHTSFNRDESSAAKLKNHASYVLEKIIRLRSPKDKELRLTLGDMEAMAHLGNYYAEMMLGNKKAAAGHWRQYAAVASSQYNPQLLGRAGWGDWKEFYSKIDDNGSPSIRPTRGGTILEAEAATVNNAITENSIAGATGLGYVTPGSENASIEWTYEAPEAGEYTLELRYILENGNQDLPLSINGKAAGTINFWTTGGNDCWAWDRKVVSLNSGLNTIKIDVDGVSPHIDHLNILGGEVKSLVNITSPNDGIIFMEPADTTIKASVDAGDTNIDSLEFRSNGMLVATDYEAPYSFETDKDVYLKKFICVQ